MSKNDLVHNSRECEKVLWKNDCPIRNASGSHRIATLPDGSKLTYPDHGEWGNGLAHKITKMLVAAGLLTIVACLAMGAIAWIGTSFY